MSGGASAGAALVLRLRPESVCRRVKWGNVAVLARPAGLEPATHGLDDNDIEPTAAGQWAQASPTSPTALNLFCTWLGSFHGIDGIDWACFPLNY
jgi:hypothetical protein